MDPLTIGAIASGAGSILGGLGFGKKSPDNAHLIQLQEESALRHEKNSFDQKMALAKSHGLHPLSVLGVPMATFAPSISNEASGPDFSSIGYGMGQLAQASVGKQAEQPQRGAVVDPRQDRLISANIDIAEANAQRARIGAERDAYEFERSKLQSMAALMGGPGRPSAVNRSNDAQYGGVLVKPDEQKSARSASEPHITAGLHPFLSEFQVSRSRKGLLPQTFADDAEIPAALLPLIIQENVSKYGLTNTLRAFGFGEGNVSDPISRWLTKPDHTRQWYHPKPKSTHRPYDYADYYKSIR